MENKDYKELVEFLGGQFTKIDERFDRVDERFDKIDERFDGIDRRLDRMDERFDRVDERFNGIEAKLENLEETKADKSDVNILINSIDRLAKSIETYHHEHVALCAKVDRMEEWINQIAEKVGIKLES